jgi:hypothetical protein
VPPSISTQPQPQTVKASSNVTFWVVATGTEPLSYQWSFKDVPIPGATDTNYTRYSVVTADSGDYQVTITNRGGSKLSDDALLNVLPLQPPVISTQPQSRAAAMGGSASFSVSATSSLPLRYQWRLNNVDLSGKTDATLSLSNVESGDLGSYTVRVSNDDGWVLSDPASLSAAVQPNISSFAGDAAGFRLTFGTELGPVYVVEYKSGTTDNAWHELSTVPGTGSPATVTNAPLTATVRFYRVKIQ